MASDQTTGVEGIDFHRDGRGHYWPGPYPTRRVQVLSVTDGAAASDSRTADLITRLRGHAALRSAMNGDNGNTAMLRAAADEIERLRGHVRQLRSVIEDALMWDGADDTGVDAVWRESAEEALKETK